MTADEADTILGPDVCAWMDAHYGPPPPLSPAQITVLAALLDVEHDVAHADVA